MEIIIGKMEKSIIEMKIKKRIANDMYLLFRCVNKIQSMIVPIKVLSTYETIELLKQGYSVSRYGDGEYNICLNIHGHPIFQDMSSDLKDKMNNILNTDWRGEKFIVAQIGMLSSDKLYSKKVKKYFASFLFTRRNKIVKLLWDNGRKQVYGDSFFPRVDVWEDDSVANTLKIVEKLNEIWENKELLIIEGEAVRLGVNNDLLHSAKGIKRIIIPNKNAFFVYDDIMEKIDKAGKFDIALIVAGPTATALAADIYLKGHQAIDFGQMQRGYVKKMQEKRMYKYPIMSESQYEKQIIYSIKL